MASKIYRLAYIFETGDVKFSGWVRAEDMADCKARVNAIQQAGANSSDGVPPTIVGWEEKKIEADET